MARHASSSRRLTMTAETQTVLHAFALGWRPGEGAGFEPACASFRFKELSDEKVIRHFCGRRCSWRGGVRASQSIRARRQHLRRSRLSGLRRRLPGLRRLPRLRCRLPGLLPGALSPRLRSLSGLRLRLSELWLRLWLWPSVLRRRLLGSEPACRASRLPASGALVAEARVDCLA